MEQPLVIIPTYNERENVPRLMDALRAFVPEAHILIVDDNSPDGTGTFVQELADSDQHIHILHRPAKEGLGRAYQAGFAWALDRKDFNPICTMDADLSHDPQDLVRLLSAWEKDTVIVGSRYVPGGRIIGWHWSRYLLSWTANRLTKLLLGLRPTDVTAGYKCYPRTFLANLDLKTIVSPGYAFQVEMIAAAQAKRLKILEIPITFVDRTIGRSKVSRHELATSSRSLLTLTSRRPGFRQFGKFSIIGMLNFAIDLGVTNLLVLVAHWPATWSGYTGTAVALINSFYFNRWWTFKGRSTLPWQEFGRFVAVNGSGAGINSLAYTLLLTLLGWHYNLAKIGAIASSVLWNFLGTKHFVFQPSKQGKQIDDHKTA